MNFCNAATMFGKRTAIFWIFYAILGMSSVNAQDNTHEEMNKYEANRTSELYRHLTANNISKKVRPEGIVGVSVNFKLLTINYLDTREQTLSTTGFLNVKWHDNRMRWSIGSSKDTSVFMMPDEVWLPSLLVKNEVNHMTIIHDKNIPVRIDSAGEMEWILPMFMTTSCGMDVSYYPIDIQTCEIKVTSWSYSKGEMLLSIDVDDILEEYAENSEWTMLNLNSTMGRDKKKSVIVYTLTLQRRPTNYIMNAILPTMLMSFLSPLVFLLPAEAGERVSYIITVFLAFLVTLSMVSEQLPSSSKTVSIFSIYLTSTTMNSGLAVLLTVLSLQNYHKSCNDDVSRRVNKFSSFLEVIMLRRRKSGVKPDDESVNGRTKITENLKTGPVRTWKEIALIVDTFCFRFQVTVALVLCLVFTLSLCV